MARSGSLLHEHLRRYHKRSWTIEQENSKMIIALVMDIKSNKVFAADVGSDFVLFLVKFLCTSLRHPSDLISPEIPICSIGNLHNSFKNFKNIFEIPSSPLEPNVSKQKSIPSSSSSPFPMLVAKNRKLIGRRYLITDDLKVMILYAKNLFDQLPENCDYVEVVEDIEFGQEEAVVFMNAMMKSTTVLTDTFASAAAKKKAKEMDAEATNTVVPAIS